MLSILLAGIQFLKAWHYSPHKLILVTTVRVHTGHISKNVVGALTQLSLGILKKFKLLSLPLIFLYSSSYPDPKLLAPNCARWRKRGAI